MNISINVTQFEDLAEASRESVEQKLAPVGRLLGADEATALMEIELAHAPAEGRSATPTRLVARVTTLGEVFRAEAVKPTPEAAADRVRATLEQEIRKVRGKGKSAWKKGAERAKDWLRFGS